MNDYELIKLKIELEIDLKQLRADLNNALYEQCNPTRSEIVTIVNKTIDAICRVKDKIAEIDKWLRM